MFRVFKSPGFEKKASKILTRSELLELEKLIEKMKLGIITGKTITYDFPKEKKIGGKKIYFLVYANIKIVLLVSASNKKYQQETIDEIKLLLPEFKKYAYNLKY